MSKVCELCGKRPVAGRRYSRRGLAKYKGGVGRKITGITKRKFTPNIQKIRIRTEEGSVRRIRLCTKCLKTGLRDGTLLKAVRKPRTPRKVEVPPAAAPAPGQAPQQPERTPSPADGAAKETSTRPQAKESQGPSDA